MYGRSEPACQHFTVSSDVQATNMVNKKKATVLNILLILYLILYPRGGALQKKTMKDYFTDITPITVKHTIINRPASQTTRRRRMADSININYKKSDAIAIKRKVKRHFSVKQSLDLHGMTYDEAFREVVAFFSKCQNVGIRNVLVITGGNPLRKTILRSAFVNWCRNLLGEFVVSYSSADLKHGGDGAFYVILKSKR